MNNGIKNKLKTLIGEEIDESVGYGNIKLTYPSGDITQRHKILRIEDEDCVVLGHGKYEIFISIDHISELVIWEK